MKFRPSQDRILVRRLEADATTAGGIFIPETHREKPNWGEVVSLGTGRKLEDGRSIPIAFNRGDHVLFGRFSGTEIKIDGVEYTILREDEVLGSVAAEVDEDPRYSARALREHDEILASKEADNGD